MKPNQHGCVVVCLFVGFVLWTNCSGEGWRKGFGDYVFAKYSVCTLQGSDCIIMAVSLSLLLSLYPFTSPHTLLSFSFSLPIFPPPFSSSSSCIGSFLILSLLWATIYMYELSYWILITTLSSRYWLIFPFPNRGIRLSNLFMGI